MQTPLCAQRALSPTFHKTSAARESQRLRSRRPQTGREVFQFPEALNEDGCFLGCFSHLAQTLRLSLEHPQESIFFFLFTCQLHCCASLCNSQTIVCQKGKSHYCPISKQQPGSPNTHTKLNSHPHLKTLSCWTAHMR